MPDSPTPETPEEKKERKRAEQDQAMADAISAALEMIATARDHPEIVALLAPRGYTVAALEEALTTKQEPAQKGFDARQVALGQYRSATKALSDTEKLERKDFADYREIARAVFPLAADRVALGLNGSTPGDLQKFLTAAKACYAAGKKAPYTAKLTERGYAPPALEVELQGLKAVSAQATAQASAKGKAKNATDVRDAAADELAKWVAEFRKVAKRTLRTRPDLLSSLGM